MATTVIIDAGSLQPAETEAVRAACAAIGAASASWPVAAGAVPPERASLLVAGLAAGRRRIEEPLLDAAVRVWPGLPLLLLCREPVARDTVVLDGGRVTLVPLPQTAEALARRLPGLVAGGEIAMSEAALPAVRTATGAGWWAAAIGEGARPPGAAGATGQADGPAVVGETDLVKAGTTDWASLVPAEAAAGAKLPAWPSSVKGAAVLRPGSDGVVRLRATGGWAAGVRMWNPLRVPAEWGPVAAGADETVAALRSEAGDLWLLAPPSVLTGAGTEAVRRAAGCGGAALVGHLRRAGAGGVVIELRSV